MDQRSVRDILAGKTYFIRTFGCQMNQHDSERLFWQLFEQAILSMIFYPRPRKIIDERTTLRW